MENQKFIIPQVSDNEEKPEQEKVAKKVEYRIEPFVSSFHGLNVKDEIFFHSAKYGNQGRQYDIFRDEENKINKEDYKDYVTIPRDETTSSKTKPPINQNKQEKVRFVKPAFLEKETSDSVDESKHQFQDIEIELEEEKTIDLLDSYQNTSNQDTNYQDTSYQEIKNEKTPPKKKKSDYVAPPLSLLKRGRSIRQLDMSFTQYQLEKINQTLIDFAIGGEVVHYTKGPAVTQFEVQLEAGVKVERVKNIASNLQANLKAKNIRIQAPIPGKSTIGIEVPNNATDVVLFGELLGNNDFLNDNNPVNTVLGLDLSGNPVYLNIAKMPHCLIGGTTGSGKSVCINSIITSIIYKAHPDDVKLILIDPKVIEFTNYEDIPHLATAVITEPKIATASLRWAVEEMEKRYQLFRSLRVREYDEYSKMAKKDINIKHIPYIIIIIDELADLMMTSGNDVEDYIQRLTQKGRASGIHLIVATQRPSVDVIKGTIKTNIPTRIAFMVKTYTDSSIILDHGGAEKLLGQGDMLYNDSVNELRLQGSFISSEEIKAVTNFVRSQNDTSFLFSQEELKQSLGNDEQSLGLNDEYFREIAIFIVENKSASINRIQQVFRVGFNRAQAIVQSLEELGVVSENLGSRAREVQVDRNELEEILAKNGL